MKKLLPALVMSMLSTPAFAQGAIQLGGRDAFTAACPRGPRTGDGIDPIGAWDKGQDYASIEGDGPMGTNWGHTPEALEWFCKASVAGNAIAAYDIAEILREGFSVNSVAPGGVLHTTRYLGDWRAAFYWYERSANGGFTKGMLAVAQYYALGDEVLRGSGVPRNPQLGSKWLDRAADGGDTMALYLRSTLYDGNPSVSWISNLPTRKGHTATDDREQRTKLFKKFDDSCSFVLKEMKSLLPDTDRKREVESTSLKELVGSDISKPMQFKCIVRLKGAAEPPVAALGQQFEWLTRGGGFDKWSFTVTHFPGRNDALVRRATVAQGFAEVADDAARVADAVMPARPPTSTAGVRSGDAVASESQAATPPTSVNPEGRLSSSAAGVDSRELRRVVLRLGPGDAERSLKSRRSAVPVRLDVTNLTDVPIRLVWIDFEGRRDQRGPLSAMPRALPGETISQSSWTGHTFIVTDESGRALCSLTVGESDSIATIARGSCPPTSPAAPRAK